MIRINPALDDGEMLRLFREGVKSQWDWEQLGSEEVGDVPAAQKAALAQVITPVYLGEQTAMIGVSAVIPMMLNANHTEAAMYLSSMGLDEARHFRNLNRLYRLLHQDPAPRSRLPEMWRYHARLLHRREPVEWVWGILISDLFAKRFYGGLYRRFPDALVGRLAHRTLQDEARHQAFSDRYLTRMLPTMSREGHMALLRMRDDLFRTMEALGRRLEPSMDELAWSQEEFVHELWRDTEKWVARLGIGQDYKGQADGTDDV